MNPMMPGMPTGGRSQMYSTPGFTQTGVPGLGGGYAFPPGSQMCIFMDGLNQTVRAANVSPTGQGDVISWAQGLAAKSKARAAMASGGGMFGAMGGTGAGGMDLMSMMNMLKSYIPTLQSMMGAKK